MKNILEKLFSNCILTEAEAFDVLSVIGKGGVNPAQLASFITVYRMRDIALDELKGFRKALLELCVKVQLASENAIDLCGTGGDSKSTFNISTLASFVVAGAGGRVIKHGNYGVSSISGSSTVLEQLGCRFTSNSDILARSLDETGICFLHAPLFHTALKNVAIVRNELGVRTFFNMLGPLVNPAQPSNRLTGVYSAELLRKYVYLLQETNEIFTLVHSEDGFDEISLTGPTRIITGQNESYLTPSMFGLPNYQHSDLFGGTTARDAALIFEDVLSNRGTPAQNDVVCINAAMALQNLGVALDVESGIAHAREVLYSGRALTVFKKFVGINSKVKIEKQ